MERRRTGAIDRAFRSTSIASPETHILTAGKISLSVLRKDRSMSLGQ